MGDKKVFVSGFFDCFHGGHAEFLRKAAEYGELYVSVGSDKNLFILKETRPIFNEKERCFIVSQIKGVQEAFISKGLGKLDFIEDLDRVKPEIFIVNNDGNTKEKERACLDRNINYIILERTEKSGLPKRSSTELRAKLSKIPFRIDLCGGWLDQPYISRIFPGPVITISVEPNEKFNSRSGMASSTRNKAILLWKDKLPNEDPFYLAKILFSYDNPPGTNEYSVAGAQDSIGIAVPGVVYSFFKEDYWPKEIKQCLQEDILSWLEDKIYLVELKPRESDYSPFDNAQINLANVQELSFAAKECYKSIVEKDLFNFAESVRKGFEAQCKLFPATFPDWIKPILNKYKEQGVLGWKLSGAGGGGYLILISDKPIEDTIRIKIRRS